MERVPGNLADMIDVIDDPFNGKANFLGFGFAALPSWNHHPCVEDRANDSAAVNQRFNLFIGELAIVIHQRAAVVMARPDWAGIMIERLPEAIVTEMRGIENDSKALHFL